MPLDAAGWQTTAESECDWMAHTLPPIKTCILSLEVPKLAPMMVRKGGAVRLHSTVAVLPDAVQPLTAVTEGDA